ncbi:MAG: DUF302 domain-containing protein [Deltaproteobacteria bacterium]|nr:DUF302 domain-containing protein [Deltaproteobacteria bacterium]
MRTKKIISVSIIVGVLCLTALSASAGERVDTVSQKGFKGTVDAVTKAVKSRGMMVVATIDHQNMLTMVGTKIAGSKTIEFGKPDMGKMVLTMDPGAGLDMPGKIYVFEKDGRTTVSYSKTDFARYNPGFSEVDKMMGMMVAEIVKEATQ